MIYTCPSHPYFGFFGQGRKTRNIRVHGVNVKTAVENLYPGNMAKLGKTTNKERLFIACV